MGSETERFLIRILFSVGSIGGLEFGRTDGALHGWGYDSCRR